MPEKRHEYSEFLWITTGVPGQDQENSFTNATLQATETDPNLEFSVAVHVGIRRDIETEAQLRDYLRDVFQAAIDGVEMVKGAQIAVEIQLGPAGRGE